MVRVALVVGSVVVATASAGSRANSGFSSPSTVATKAIDGVIVYVGLESNEIWRLQVQNDTDDDMSVAWDESTILGPDGQSWGRLSAAPDGQRMDTSAAHPPSPLFAHSRIVEQVIPSRFRELPWSPASLAGVRLVLSIHRGGERLVWESTVK